MKPALRDSAAAFAAALFASGCTTTIVSPNLDGLGAARLNSEKAVFAIKSPDLIRCDELACYYGPHQNYYIRNVRCPEGQVIASICDYERAKADGVIRLGKADTLLVWTTARSSLSRTGKGLWRIGADSIEQREKP
ncbi:hypothetical protein [Sphingopyxis witflariensis]|uniref:hypothetical protein n=1 Tax=Sphingopyxis witflariensis TaxID=173675 RepID=UPI0011817A5B|nr:hypothetical protein [Sphingopyxis witflariensis]